MSTIDINITFALTVALAAVSFLVAAMYGILSPWWTHRTGIGLFTTLAALMAVTGLTAWQWFASLNLYVAWAASVLMIAALAFMGAVIGREQIRGKRPRKVWHAIRYRFRRKR